MTYTLKQISNEIKDLIQTADVEPVTTIEINRTIPNELNSELNMVSEIKAIFQDGSGWKWSRTKADEEFTFSMIM